MPNPTAYWQRFKTEPIYLWEDQEQVYVRSVPGGGYFAKYKGYKEFAIYHTDHIVVRAIAARQEVTKEEYEQA